uniref:Uncharacterized protein n=1 Tax=Glossina pallidipes TaxID=7398 RepID=A0A1B0AHC0_GLOPL
MAHDRTNTTKKHYAARAQRLAVLALMHIFLLTTCYNTYIRFRRVIPIILTYRYVLTLSVLMSELPGHSTKDGCTTWKEFVTSTRTHNFEYLNKKSIGRSSCLPEASSCQMLTMLQAEFENIKRINAVRILR